MFHVTAPGQEEGAAPLAEGFEYPTMEQLSEQVGSDLLAVVSDHELPDPRGAQPLLPGALHRGGGGARGERPGQTRPPGTGGRTSCVILLLTDPV